jgi:hypothetical protein
MQITNCPKCGVLYETTTEAANEPLWMNTFGARHQWPTSKRSVTAKDESGSHERAES